MALVSISRRGIFRGPTRWNTTFASTAVRGSTRIVRQVDNSASRCSCSNVLQYSKKNLGLGWPRAPQGAVTPFPYEHLWAFQFDVKQDQCCVYRESIVEKKRYAGTPGRSAKGSNPQKIHLRTRRSVTSRKAIQYCNHKPCQRMYSDAYRLGHFAGSTSGLLRLTTYPCSPGTTASRPSVLYQWQSKISLAYSRPLFEKLS